MEDRSCKSAYVVGSDSRTQCHFVTDQPDLSDRANRHSEQGPDRNAEKQRNGHIEHHISIGGKNAGDFAQTHTCGTMLSEGSSCSIDVTFKPTSSGTRTAAVSVTDNATDSPQMVSLSGTDTAGSCTPAGAQCPPQRPPCCPGLMCVLEGDRAFCAGKPSEHNPRADSFWDRLNPNKLD